MIEIPSAPTGKDSEAPKSPRNPSPQIPALHLPAASGHVPTDPALPLGRGSERPRRDSGSPALSPRLPAPAHGSGSQTSPRREPRSPLEGGSPRIPPRTDSKSPKTSPRGRPLQQEAKSPRGEKIPQGDLHLRQEVPANRPHVQPIQPVTAKKFPFSKSPTSTTPSRPLTRPGPPGPSSALRAGNKIPRVPQTPDSAPKMAGLCNWAPQIDNLPCHFTTMSWNVLAQMLVFEHDLCHPSFQKWQYRK
jgi:hypothetical protein